MGLFSAKPQPNDASFDAVTLTLPSGEVRKLTRKEFEALPLAERVRAILGNQMKFFRDGTEIPMKQALGRD